MASKISVAGPCHMYVDGGYLGTAERSPDISIVPAYENAMNAIGGTMLPTDTVFQAEHAFVRADLTRFDLSVLQTAAQRGTRSGILSIGDGFTSVLICVFPFMNTGFRFFNAVMEGPDDYKDVSTAAMKVGVMFHALHNPKADATFNLYDNSVGGVPAPA
jgi:hypothetical protein